ncbi:MAG TPA: GIY-YIG nuclease family protein [Candidatus Absconditabacterales bacterium]|nr:GIY-YIG nuclease family protein [Candidatus Absconditabacterales bacterium]
MRYTYILRCQDNTLYTGVTNDLEKRIFDHNNSKTGAKYTKSRRPVKLVRNQKTKNKVSAMQLEYKIKKMSKEKKEKMIIDLI